MLQEITPQHLWILSKWKTKNNYRNHSLIRMVFFEAISSFPFQSYSTTTISLCQKGASLVALFHQEKLVFLSARISISIWARTLVIWINLVHKKTVHHWTVFLLSKNNLDYASKGIIETNDLSSAFFWNFTIPSTLACKVWSLPM